MLRRLFVMLGIILVAVAALAAYKGFSIYRQIQVFTAPRPAISVSAVIVEEHLWEHRIPAIGSLRAFQGIDLAAEVNGIVREVLFNSGEKIALGQALVQMDSEVEQASLATAQAQLGLSRVEYERGRSLVRQQNISQSEFDRLSAELQKANANVAQLKATLDKKRILAPFSGTIGIRQVDPGNYLSPGSPIATLQDLSRLYVDFFLPEQETPLLMVEQKILVRVPAYPNEIFEGKISAINPKVEGSTRNLQIRGTLVNPDEKLLPGMFAHLEVILPENTPQIVVPETAVTYTLYGNSVYIVRDRLDDQGQPVKDAQGQPVREVERRFVETGERRGGRVLLLKGVRAGEQVVTSGQLKLDNGTHVEIVDDLALPLQTTEQTDSGL